MKITTLNVLLFLIPLFFFSCKSDDRNTIDTTADCPKATKIGLQDKNLNVSIFLDLSDRISPERSPNPAMDYWKRDLGYIESITSGFQNHLRNKKVVTIDDQIRLRLHPLPDNIDDINTIVKTLDKSFTKDNATLDEICGITSDYRFETEYLYRTMLEQKEPAAEQGIDDYPGSDIFGFFKSNVKDYCIKDGYRNILFILTDGYEYYRGNSLSKNSENKSNYLLSKSLIQWGFTAENYRQKLEEEDFGFQAPVTGLDDLEIYVIGIAPKQSWELDVINHYWSQWFKEMGVKNYQDSDWKSYFKDADLPANLDHAIKEFIYR